MQGNQRESASAFRRAASAIAAALLAFALAFMAFDAGALRSAFASDEMTGDGLQQPVGGEDADSSGDPEGDDDPQGEAIGGGAQAAEEGAAPVEGEDAAAEGEQDAVDARAGPVGTDGEPQAQEAQVLGEGPDPVEQWGTAGGRAAIEHMHYGRDGHRAVFHQGRSMDDPLLEGLAIASEYGVGMHDRWPKASGGDGSNDPDGFGTAQYVTAQEDDGGQRYRYSADAYSLYGWFHADSEDVSDAPFDFGQGITRDTSIVARWRMAGMFDIAYSPVMDVPDGTVSGDIRVPLDGGYADLSPTYVMNTPENVESTDGGEYEFVGWRVVESFDEGAAVLDEGLYREGDGFVVDSGLAKGNVIHLQAVYEQTSDASGEPDSPDASGVEVSADADATGASGASAGIADGSAQGSAGEDAADASADASASAFPMTEDAAQALTVAIAGIALLSLGVALIARAMRQGRAKVPVEDE